jgi:uncharacterized delta-60 repeat protein
MFLRASFAAALLWVPALCQGAEGDLDVTFGTGGVTSVALGSGCTVTALARQSDGRLVAAGYVQSGGTAGRDGCLMRFTSAGQLDSTFGSNGVVTVDFGTTSDWLNSLLILDNNLILAAGFKYGYGGATPVVARIKADGSLDSSFGIGGKLDANRMSGHFGSTLLAAADNGFYLGSSSGAVMKYDKYGFWDSNYGSNGVAVTGISASTAKGCFAHGPDGSLLVGGARHIDGNSRGTIARLTYEGRLDSAFGTGGLVENNVSTAYYDSYDVIEFDPFTNTVLALGTINGGNVPTAYKVFISRFKTDGRLDTDMGSQGTAIMDFGPLTNLAHDFKRLPDGRLLICASYQDGNNGTVILSRRLANGAADLGFRGTGFVSHSFGGFSQAPAVMLQQPDAKVVIAGYSFISGAQRAALMRLEYDPVIPGKLQVLHKGVGLYPGLASVLDFGLVNEGTGVSTLRVTLKNTGTTSLAGVQAGILQDDAVFGLSQASDSPWTLNAGETRELDITFSASPLGSYEGVLRITSTTEPGLPFEVRLKAVLGTPGLPIIQLPPKSLMIVDKPNAYQGSSTLGSLSVTASNSLSLPQSYQWHLDGADIPQETRSQLNLHRDSAAGVYTVTITTSKGSVTSQPAMLAVLRHSAVSVIAPTGTQTVYAYRGNPAVLPMDVRLPAGTTLSCAWVNATNIPNIPLQEGAYTGVTGTTLRILSTTTDLRGIYLCTTSWKDGNGTLLASGTFQTYLDVLGPPQIFSTLSSYDLEPSANITLTSDMLNLRIENRPTRYDVTGLPPGLEVSSSGPTSLIISGTTTDEAAPGSSYPVTIGVFSPAGYNTFTFVIRMVKPTLGGSYQGLVSTATMDAHTVQQNSGLLQFNITDEGKVSGALLQDGIRRSFKGTVMRRGATISFLLPSQAGLPASTLKLDLPSSGPSGTGTLHPGHQVDSEPTHFITFARSSIAEWPTERRQAIQGRYNVIVQTSALGTEPFPLPLGHGTLSVVVSRSGTAAWSCRLPDGQSLTGSSPVLGLDQPRLYLGGALYQNTGSFGGVLDWPANLEPAFEKPVGGYAVWNKPARKSDASYPQGFITQMQFTGMNYTPPTKRRTYMNLRQVAFGDFNANLTIQLEDAEEMRIPVRFTGPDSADMVFSGMRLILNPSGGSGLIQGSIFFRQQDRENPRKFHQRAGFIYGIAVPDSSISVYGHLLIHALPEPGKPPRWISGTVLMSRSRADD